MTATATGLWKGYDEMADQYLNRKAADINLLLDKTDALTVSSTVLTAGDSVDIPMKSMALLFSQPEDSEVIFSEFLCTYTGRSFISSLIHGVAGIYVFTHENETLTVKNSSDLTHYLMYIAV